MKLTALLAFKNEEWILPAYISSIAEVVDEIVAVDDGSTDNSAALLTGAGALVKTHSGNARAGWDENNIRDSLLKLGRERGGTHFLCLDADEALTAPAQLVLRDEISSLDPGQKLAMQWLALWKDPRRFRNDASVWSDNFKDFAFADDGANRAESSGGREWGVFRTPGPNSEHNWRRLPADKGAVFHFQFVPWQRFQAKQAWYRCVELIGGQQSPYQINRMYAPTLDDAAAGCAEVPAGWYRGIDVPSGLASLPASWQLESTLQLFTEHGVGFFEPLQIWHVPELRERFIAEVGREPKPDLTLRVAGRLGQIWRSRFASRS